MSIRTIFCAGTTPAIHFAREYLSRHTAVTDAPRWDCGHLLLDVPSFHPGSCFADPVNLDTLLAALPSDITVWGGSLDHPALKSFTVIDLLQDEIYLAENAAITAHCAITVANSKLPVTLQKCPTLITGWGRIGKHLSFLLKNAGGDVTVASRKESEKALLTSMNFTAVDYSELDSVLPGIRLIFNTVPEMILPEELLSACKHCIKIDLASKRGIGGADVIWARGLPGIHAPEASGILIGKTVLRRMKEVTP